MVLTPVFNAMAGKMAGNMAGKQSDETVAADYHAA